MKLHNLRCNISQRHLLLLTESRISNAVGNGNWDVFRTSGRGHSNVLWKITALNMRIMKLSLYRSHNCSALLFLNGSFSLKIIAHFDCFFLWLALVELVCHGILFRLRCSVSMWIIWAVISPHIDVAWVLDRISFGILLIFAHSTRFQNFLYILNL